MTWVLGLGREGIEGRDRAVTSGHLEAHWVERLESGSLLPKLSLGHVIRNEVFKMLATGRLVLKNLAVRVFPEALRSLELPAGLPRHTVTLSPTCVFDGCIPSALLFLTHK